MAGVIIFPTDTVYGIGCRIFDIESIKKIYKIKKRPLDKPLACLCASLQQVESIAYVTDDARKLINKFLPGPLTLILKSKPLIKEKIGYETIGVRIPDCKIALNILNENGPMLTTSVNESGSVPLNEYAGIVDMYSSVVDKIYESNSCSSNISSTVIMCIDNEIKLIREGEIKFAEIINV